MFTAPGILTDLKVIHRSGNNCKVPKEMLPASLHHIP